MGTRISEETSDKPKPMVLVRGEPILWHVMSIYAAQGYQDFIVAGGYRCEVISEWANSVKENWRIQVIDTGGLTQTAGRIKRCLENLNDENFFLTYGDGLGNVNLKELIDTHNRNSSVATVTAVRPPARFGSLEIRNEKVDHFGEKSQLDEGWINGGFFLIRSEISGYLRNDSQIFESEVLPRLARFGHLSAYKHYGFWKPMDTLREKMELEELAKGKSIPWLTL